MTRAFWETESPQASGRYEIKMVFNGLEAGFVKSLVLGHSLIFKPAYPTRQVNNIYFDSVDFQLQDAHTQGSYQRFKIRLRWYHATWLVSPGFLEIKSKTGKLGQKLTRTIPQELDLTTQSWREIQASIENELEPKLQNLIRSTVPSLINYYQRDYYQSADGLIRITLDTSHHAFDQRFGPRPNLTRELPIRNETILEIKADSSRHEEIASLLDEFPNYCSAYSKYIQGTETMFG